MKKNVLCSNVSPLFFTLLHKETAFLVWIKLNKNFGVLKLKITTRKKKKATSLRKNSFTGFCSQINGLSESATFWKLLRTPINEKLPEKMRRQSKITKLCWIYTKGLKSYCHTFSLIYKLDSMRRRYNTQNCFFVDLI